MTMSTTTCTFSAITIVLLSSQANAQTVIASRIAWAHNLRVAITLPKGWVIIHRDPVSNWREKAYGMEIRNASEGGHLPTGTTIGLVFERFWRGRHQRAGTLPGMKSDAELGQEGHRYIRRARIPSGQRVTIATYDSSRDKTVGSDYKPKCFWYLTLEFRADDSTIGLCMAARQPNTPQLNRAIMAILQSVRIQRNLSSAIKAARRRHGALVYVP